MNILKAIIVFVEDYKHYAKLIFLWCFVAAFFVLFIYLSGWVGVLIIFVTLLFFACVCASACWEDIVKWARSK